ncbi:MAG: TetR/AcrR family transcriptional regulator [Actinomycetia bacterium]|nr:TetR/AcrR family transcriptional regulator [Actinomycetes bacterium]
MPRLTAANRASRHDEITAAARRCFSRDGFHHTSMPDIAAEAGVSTGAPYRYFASKDAIIAEIAGQAFRSIFDSVLHARDGDDVGIPDLIEGAVTQQTNSGEGAPVPELFRCVVQAWAEILRDPALEEQAKLGIQEVRDAIADMLLRRQAAGQVSAQIDGERLARVVIALVHGLILQRTIFDADDIPELVDQIRIVLSSTSVTT